MSKLGTLLRGSVVMIVGAATLTVGPAEAKLASNLPSDIPTFTGMVRDIVYRGSVVYVAGNFEGVRVPGEPQPVPRSYVAAIDTNTGELLDWNPKPNGPVHALAVTRKSVILGGSFTSVNGRTRSRLAMVSRSTGAVDRKLKPTMNKAVNVLRLTSNRLYVGGKFTRVNGKIRKRLVSFDKSRYRVTDWRPKASGPVYALASARGRMYVGGDFAKLNRSNKAASLAAVSTKGKGRLTKWNPPVHYPVWDVVRHDGKVYVGTGGPGGRLYAINDRGRVKWQKTFDGDVQALAVLDRRLYVGGHYENICSTSRTGNSGSCRDASTARGKLSAFRLDGRLTTWSPDADSALGVLTMARRSDRLSVGGTFTTFNAETVRRPCFAEFRL